MKKTLYDYEEMPLVGDDLSDESTCKVDRSGFVPFEQQIEQCLEAGIAFAENQSQMVYDPEGYENNSPAVDRDFSIYDNHNAQTMAEFLTPRVAVDTPAPAPADSSAPAPADTPAPAPVPEDAS